MRLFRSPSVAVAFAALTAAFLHGQQTPLPVQSADNLARDKDAAIVLSPFEVNADNDFGYVGQNTLAGSRMNTSLKDIAAAISPMTAEFLQDIAATNVTEAMEYGMNARMETDDSRAAGPVADGNTDSIPDIRIRGLPGGSRTVNYFRALDEVDMFKVERLDLSRGPNSILYGFGSPAGVANSSTKQAKLGKAAFSTNLRVDSWNGYRVAFDANVPVINNKLAFRAVALRSEESSWRSAGHSVQKRLYLTGTWRIDGKTTLKADFERGIQSRFVPRPFFGLDLLLPWQAAGARTLANFDLSRPAGSVGTPGNPIRSTGATAIPGVQEITTGNRVVVSDAFPYAQDYRFFTWSERLSPLQTDFVLGRSNPEAAFEANWVGAKYNSKSYSATLQRQLFSGLNAELAFSQQSRKSEIDNLSSWNTYGLMADPNLSYPNGAPKPANNLYYYELTQMKRPNDQHLQQLRAVLSYERDVGKVARVRVAGLYEQSRNQNRLETQEQRWLNGPELTSGGAFNPDPTNAANSVWHRYYVGTPNVVNDRNYRIPGPYDLSGGTLFQDPATGATRRIYAHFINRNSGNVDFWDEKLRSSMAVAQLYLLKNRVVLSAGFRKDQLKHFEIQPIREPGTTGNTGIFIPMLPGDEPTSVLKGDTHTIGGVVHLTPWLSGFYNTSNSVNVPGDFPVFGADPTIAGFDSSAPLRDGKTRDFGLKLDLFGNRLFVTATRFETEAHNDVYFSSFTSVKTPLRNVWSALRSSGGLPAADQAIAEAAFQATGAPSAFLLDSNTEGYEFELVGEPIRGWSISLNYSMTESRRRNMAAEVRAHIDQWRPLWLKYGDYAIAQVANTPGIERNPANDFRSPADIRATGDFTVNTDTVREAIVDMEDAFFDLYHVYEGLRYVGDNKHNLNLRSRYSFREGGLKGLTVGGGMRLRRGRIAGSLVDYEFSQASDYTDPYNGRVVKSVKLIETADQALFDLQISYRRPLSLFKKKVGWTIQLNVNNATDEDELIVNQTHPTTGRPLTYRYQDPRRFILTNTFSF